MGGMRSDPIAREAVVHGHVQGVYFRAGCRQRADELGVTGWVSNEPDGTVRAHVEGPPEAVEALLAWLGDGPPRARVDRVEVTHAAWAGYPAFDTR